MIVDKVTTKLQAWSAKLLSYVGRIQLVRSVIMSIQSFWSQIFYLPKKVLKLLNVAYCKFIWAGDWKGVKKRLVSWEIMCLPKICGGWNFRDMNYWNKASLLKILWAIEGKKDRLWVQWLHAYFSNNMICLIVLCLSLLLVLLGKCWRLVISFIVVGVGMLCSVIRMCL